MKKNNFLAGILCMVTIFSFGQQNSSKVNIEWAQKYTEKNSSAVISVITYDSPDIFYINKLDKWKIYSIEKHNKTTGEVQRIQWTREYKGMEKVFAFTVPMNDKIFYFSTIVNKKLKRKSLFVESFDKKTLKFNLDIKKIAEIQYTKRIEVSIPFTYKVSQDSTNILIYYQVFPVRGEVNEPFFQVLDENMNLIFEKKIKLDKLSYVLDYTIDNEENIYVLVMFRRENVSDGYDIDYEIISYKKGRNVAQRLKIGKEDTYLTSARLMFNKEKELICTGFYSKENYDIFMRPCNKGSFFMQIEKQSNKVITSKFNAHDFDFITELMSARKKKKVKKKFEKGKDIELYNFFLKEVIIKNNGDITLIAEEFFLKEDLSLRTRQQNRDMIVTKNIIIINLSAEGEIKWSKRIVKNQISSVRLTRIAPHGFIDFAGYDSYALFERNNKLYFIYNDDYENLQAKNTDKFKTFQAIGAKKKAMAVLVELDENGHFTKERLFISSEKKCILQPKNCKQISQNEMLIYGKWKKNKQFAIITFKE